MRFVDRRSGLEVIERDECLRLLAAEAVGRVAVVHGGRPYLFPVNYALDGEAIVFRTAEGTKLDAAVRGAFAVFEIDGHDRELRSGWSVITTGTVEEVVDPNDLDRLGQLDLQPWAPGARAHWVRLRPASLSGRRIVTREEP